MTRGPATSDGRGGPLRGIRVVDLGAVVAGPYATMWLADLGATVVKVEPPAGDTTRQAGHARSAGMGSVYLTLGRGKRSVCLDVKADAGRAAVLDLCEDADVFVHNMRPDAIERLGLGYDAVRARTADIVYATLAGFEPDGPYGSKPAYDDIIQGLTGIAANLQRVTGEVAYVPGVIVDKTAGLVLANAILAALFHRERTGEGQAVTVPLFETTAAFQLVEHLWDASFDPPVGPPGYVRVLEPARRPYATADGHLCALPYLDKHFEAFFDAVGRPDLAADPQLATIASRLANIEFVQHTVASIIAGETTAHWLDLFDRLGIPADTLNTLDDLLADPHLDAVGFFETVDHPTEGRLRLPRSPVRMSATPVQVDHLASRLGQHTAVELEAVGYTERQIHELFAAGVAHGEDTPQP